MTRARKEGRNSGKLDCGHSSYLEYMHGCRCEKCRAAIRERNRAAAAAGGRLHEWRDANEVVEKVRLLMSESNASMKDVAASAGVGYKWLSTLMEVGRKKCRKEYADAVLALDASDVRTSSEPVFDASGIGKALRALMSLGCTASEISNASGVDVSTILRIARRETSVARSSTMEKINRAVVEVGRRYVKGKENQVRKG